MLRARFLTAISDIDGERWDALYPGANPFVRHAFLSSVEESGSASGKTGWQPMHMLLEEDERLLAAMPLYLKTHSYGEFVFDWGWAEAYRRNGLDYYPKLLSAVPFSPVPGPRIGFARGADRQRTLTALLAAVQRLAGQVAASGWHLLFPGPGQQRLLEQSALAGQLLRRQDVQFYWQNRGYGSFDDFLSQLRSSRRKNVRRERRRVARQGIVLRRMTGKGISPSDWEHFYRCYRATYERRSGHGGYLNRSFFDLLLERMREQILLVIALRNGERLGSALFLYDRKRLYGRYWGALEEVDCLHFEACFYQGIEFCVERGLSVFDPGTQGEHKLMRGFEPARTVSFHWLADQRFRGALAEVLEREQKQVAAYERSARAYLPFRRDRDRD